MDGWDHIPTSFLPNKYVCIHSRRFSLNCFSPSANGWLVGWLVSLNFLQRTLLEKEKEEENHIIVGRRSRRKRKKESRGEEIRVGEREIEGNRII